MESLGEVCRQLSPIGPHILKKPFFPAENGLQPGRLGGSPVP
jgi:hypothetical protein